MSQQARRLLVIGNEKQYNMAKDACAALSVDPVIAHVYSHAHALEMLRQFRFHGVFLPLTMPNEEREGVLTFMKQLKKEEIHIRHVVTSTDGPCSPQENDAIITASGGFPYYKLEDIQHAIGRIFKNED